MARIVQKYGGTSVGDVDRIKNVAQRIKAVRDAGNELVVVVSARAEADVGRLASSDKWEQTDPTWNQRVWTDDYSNVLGAVYRRLRYGEP